MVMVFQNWWNFIQQNLTRQWTNDISNRSHEGGDITLSNRIWQDSGNISNGSHQDDGILELIELYPAEPDKTMNDISNKSHKSGDTILSNRTRQDNVRSHQGDGVSELIEFYSTEPEKTINVNDISKGHTTVMVFQNW